MDILSLIFFILFPAIIASAIFSTLIKNKFVVEHDERERMVVRNIFTGELKLLGQGIHCLGPWWTKQALVDLNKTPKTKTFLARTKDGVSVSVEVRWSNHTGHLFCPQTGHVLKDGENLICDSYIIRAIIQTDVGARDEYIESMVSSAIEKIFSWVDSTQLFLVGELDNSGRIINIKILQESMNNLSWNRKSEVSPKPFPKTILIDRKDALLDFLATSLEYEINFLLCGVGFSVDDLRVQGIQPRDEALERSFSRRQTVHNITDASQIAKDANIMGLVAGEEGASLPAAVKIVTTFLEKNGSQGE